LTAGSARLSFRSVQEALLARISEDTVLEVKRSVDIVEVVLGYFPLKRAGANYKAVCPFHQEKTPSFNVHPEKQFFKCFGCGKAGDAITFVMLFEKVEYPDAIRILADKAGIPIKYTGGGEGDGPGRDEIARALEWSAGVFRSLLKSAPEAEPARQFLARRGVSDETAERWGLGFSLDSWDHLLHRARRSGISDRVLLAAGLVIERDGKSGFYDRFRGRVIFPIRDARGKTIAFGARTLGDDQPKFINSPETAVFSKGRGFYGLDLAREEWERTRTAFIVEGYLDVIVPHQAGVGGLVATLGTALTKDHLRILRRHVDKVVLVFDSDAAGQKASERGLDMLLSENVDIFVAELPAGLDPDDVVVRHGPDRLRECLEKPREIFEFLVASLTARHGGATPASIGRIVEEILERVALIPDEVKREILVREVARRFGIEERTLRGRLSRAPGGEPAPPAVAPRVLGALEAAGRELLACALADAGVAGRIRAAMPPERYPTEALRRVADVAYGLFDREGRVDGGSLVALLEEASLMEEAAEIVGTDLVRAGVPARAESCLETLGRVEARQESRERLERLKTVAPEEADALLRQTMEAKKRRPRDHGLMPGR
jgi:DNA primase